MYACAYIGSKRTFKPLFSTDLTVSLTISITFTRTSSISCADAELSNSVIALFRYVTRTIVYAGRDEKLHINEVTSHYPCS